MRGLFGGYNPQMSAGDMAGQMLMMGFMQGMDRKRDADAWTIATNGMDAINGTDLSGGVPTLNDQTQSGYGVKDKVNQGLLSAAGIDWQNQGQGAPAAPTADDIGKGLFGSNQQAAMPAWKPSTAPQVALPDNPTAQDIKAPQMAYNEAVKGGATTTPAMTIAQAKAATNQALYKAASQMAQAGHDPRQFLPMLQQAAADKVGAYQQEHDSQQLAGLQERFNKSKNPLEQAMLAAQMKPYGLDLDPKMISTLQGEYQLITEDYGGEKRYSLVNKKDARDILTISSGPVTMNEYQQEQIKLGKEKNAIGWYNATKPPASGGRGGSGRSAQPKQLTFDQYEKANKRYGEILADVWDSSTKEDRVSKANTYKDELNKLGEWLDKDVNNDMTYIMKNGQY